MVILTDSTPMVKCRVLYIGSAVPLETMGGLDALQQPLKERYPMDNESTIEGIDSVVTVNGSCIQLQYLNQSEQVIQFPISSLTMCAAVRCVSTVNGATGEATPKFVSLNDPLANTDSKRPAIFAAITRRTQGRKVLECHGFICSSPADAMKLVKSASIAGQHYKKNGTIKRAPTVIQQPTPRPVSGTSDTSYLESTQTKTYIMPQVQQNGTVNGVSHGPSMRLIPGEPIAQKIVPGPEFFEPVSTQGYFYSGDKAEVKKYNIAKLNGHDNNENVEAQSPRPEFIPSPRPTNGYHSPPSIVESAPPRIQATQQPIYIPLGMPRQQFRPPPPPHPAMFYAPPPHPMYARPRFFSPPPPRLRPAPFMMPPGGPPPMMAAPIYVRRQRKPSDSRSRSNSHSSAGSRGSRSRSPKHDQENTEPKRVPHADSSSDESGHIRPSTPPTDYRKGGKRMSRREEYEVKYRGQSPPRSRPYPNEMPPGMAPPAGSPPYMYDYHVYPPRHGGYSPFMMYNPHGRSRSMPPPRDRKRSKSPRKKGKKNKKAKKNKHRQPLKAYNSGGYGGQGYYPQQTPAYGPARSDMSTDSHAGYNSEQPRRGPPTDDRNGGENGYELYPPRDFRRNENQFMNERNFSKSIIEETRRSRDSRAYPTAYELNDAITKSTNNKDVPEDVDFNMY